MAVLGNSLIVLLVLSSMAMSGDSRKTWVLLLSGATGYDNYSLQSMVYHACHTLLNKGIPASTIVHMNFDDVVNHKLNPVKNNLVTVANGTDNWYPGCTVDYRRDEVTTEMFSYVLSGDSEGVRRRLGREGRVIQSGPDDHVFIYMADHGSRGMFFFPGDILARDDLIRILTRMHEEKKYAKMLVYMEACYSGSMFQGVLPDNIHIMATSAANAVEEAYACCYDDFRDAFVGGVFDNAWAYDTDAHNVTVETVELQYEVVYKVCADKPKYASHPSQYGDKSFTKLTLSEFQGSPNNSSKLNPNSLYTEYINQEPQPISTSIPKHLRHLSYSATTDGSLFYQDIDLVHPPFDMLEIATPARRLLKEKDPDLRNNLVEKLDKLNQIRLQGEAFFKTLIIEAFGKVKGEILLSKDDSLEIEKPECYKSAVAMFQDSCPGLDMFQHTFLRRHLSRLIQLCNTMPSVGVMRSLEKAARLSSVCWAR